MHRATTFNFDELGDWQQARPNRSSVKLELASNVFYYLFVSSDVTREFGNVLCILDTFMSEILDPRCWTISLSEGSHADR